MREREVCLKTFKKMDGHKIKFALLRINSNPYSAHYLDTNYIKETYNSISVGFSLFQ